MPADHKWFARVVIGSAIVSALEGLDLQFPRVDKASLQEFKQVRQALEQEGKDGGQEAGGRRKRLREPAAKGAEGKPSTLQRSLGQPRLGQPD